MGVVDIHPQQKTLIYRHLYKEHILKPMDTPRILHLLIKRFRLPIKLVAELSGVASSNVSNWIAGDLPIPPGRYLKLVKILIDTNHQTQRILDSLPGSEVCNYLIEVSVEASAFLTCHKTKGEYKQWQ